MSQPLSFTLTSDERSHLTDLIRSGNAPARVQTRARVLLLSDRQQAKRYTQKEIAALLQVCQPTVGALCRRFVLEGMASALSEKPRPGKAPKITGEIEAQLVLLACSDPPEGHARWTMQLLADKMVELRWVANITDTTVCERLKKKRTQAVADEALLHWQALGAVRGKDGRYSERV